jgi:hypothetical protein
VQLIVPGPDRDAAGIKIVWWQQQQLQQQQQGRGSEVDATDGDWRRAVLASTRMGQSRGGGVCIHVVRQLDIGRTFDQTAMAVTMGTKHWTTRLDVDRW